MLDAQKPSNPLNENITILLRRTSSSNTPFGYPKQPVLDKYLGGSGCGKFQMCPKVVQELVKKQNNCLKNCYKLESKKSNQTSGILQTTFG